MEAQFKYFTDGKPVIVLLGEMGVCKSTLGNCLINLDAAEDSICHSQQYSRMHQRFEHSFRPRVCCHRYSWLRRSEVSCE